MTEGECEGKRTQMKEAEFKQTLFKKLLGRSRPFSADDDDYKLFDWIVTRLNKIQTSEVENIDIIIHLYEFMDLIGEKDRRVAVPRFRSTCETVSDCSIFYDHGPYKGMEIINPFVEFAHNDE